MDSDMKRRDFLRTATGLGATIGILGNSAAASGEAAPPQPCATAAFPQVKDLTAHVAEFIAKTNYSDVSPEALDLGKKSILDGLGLALSGSKAETAGLIGKYADSFGFHPGGVTVLGTSAKFATRFAALANGVAIHVAD